jgi:hypothetical protein
MQMNLGAARWLLVRIVVLVAIGGCSLFPGRSPLPTQGPSRVSEASIDYVALEAEIEKVIVTGPATLDNVRAVLVSVDGETKIAHYRRRRPRARVLGDQERGQHPDRGRHR